MDSGFVLQAPKKELDSMLLGAIHLQSRDLLSSDEEFIHFLVISKSKFQVVLDSFNQSHKELLLIWILVLFFKLRKKS